MKVCEASEISKLCIVYVILWLCEGPSEGRKERKEERRLVRRPIKIVWLKSERTALEQVSETRKEMSKVMSAAGISYSLSLSRKGQAKPGLPPASW